MSHTYEYPTEGYEYVRIIVNSDWSGDATLVWKPLNAIRQEVTLPGDLFLEIFRQGGRTLYEEAFQNFCEEVLSKFMNHAEKFRP